MQSLKQQQCLQNKQCGRHRLLLAEDLSAAQQQELIDLCYLPIVGRRDVMSSENSVSRGELAGLGRVVVKHYRRGGALGQLISSVYLDSGLRRPEVELELLAFLKGQGVRVPEPVASVTKGSLFYRGWLATKEIPAVQSLPSVDRSCLDLLERALDNVVVEIRKLIGLKVHHVDLHPGNVLMDQSGEIWLVDFDKATVGQSSPKELRELYLRRWRRAVIKHGMPEIFSELFCARLRQRVEEV